MNHGKEEVETLDPEWFRCKKLFFLSSSYCCSMHVYRSEEEVNGSDEPAVLVNTCGPSDFDASLKVSKNGMSDNTLCTSVIGEGV